LKKAEEKERWNLVAEPFIVLLRDPRDVLVSSYFELLYRTKLQGKHFRKTLSEYIRSDRGSLPAIVQHQNFWSGEDASCCWHTLYYEDIHAVPLMAFSRLGDFLNLGLSKKQLDEALKYCSATNMSALETVGI